jgi:hypothetical protein
MARSTIEQLLAGTADFVTDEWQPNAGYWESIAAKQILEVL